MTAVSGQSGPKNLSANLRKLTFATQVANLQTAGRSVISLGAHQWRQCELCFRSATARLLINRLFG
jgi:hypothetical protein